jgi:hypothetical protein
MSRRRRACSGDLDWEHRANNRDRWKPGHDPRCSRPALKSKCFNLTAIRSLATARRIPCRENIADDGGGEKKQAGPGLQQKSDDTALQVPPDQSAARSAIPFISMRWAYLGILARTFNPEALMSPQLAFVNWSVVGRDDAFSSSGLSSSSRQLRAFRYRPNMVAPLRRCRPAGGHRLVHIWATSRGGERSIPRRSQRK